MLKNTQHIEIQSKHVQDYMSDFMNIKDKLFYIKSDINISIELFLEPKNYDFSKKIYFLYIVGPHFEYLHKNFIDFVDAMVELKKNSFNFEINITLTKEQLHNSKLWKKVLDSQTNFLGYISKNELQKQFVDNSILISTSILETLGLHVVEAVQHGLLSIVPNEIYSKSVYGKDIFTYELFQPDALNLAINKVTSLTNNDIKGIIFKNQQYLIDNENIKYKNCIKIFDEVRRETNVQK